MTVRKPAMRLEEDQWTRTALPTPAFAFADFHLLLGSLCDSGLASAVSDSFPESVPCLGWQAGSVLHPTFSLCLLSNLCPSEEARLGSALGLSRLLCLSEIKGTGFCWSEGCWCLGSNFYEEGTKKGSGWKLNQSLSFINKTPQKAFQKHQTLPLRVIMTLPDTHFPNCEMKLT